MSDHLNRRLEVLAKQIAADKAKTGYVRVPDFPINPPNVSTQVLSGQPAPVVKLRTLDGQWVELWLEHGGAA
jgi:hypothetical protein